MAQRMTTPVVKVVSTMLDDPAADRYGLELMRVAGLASGTLYPVLVRLVAAGWLEARWEDVDPAAAGRPARRYYRLTPTGAEAARIELAARNRRRPRVAGVFATAVAA